MPRCRRIARASGERVGESRLPAEVDHLTQIDRLPFILGGLLALLAVAALVHALVTSVARRRHDLAVLLALGFARRQVEAVVLWQASTVALVGILVGIPLGVVVGRLAWTRVADGLGVANDAAVPTVALALAVPVVLLTAVLVALLPACAAARTDVANALRTE